MECVSKTDIGMVRKTNQDAVKFNKVNDEFAWSVVCDGMGGANGGDIASAIAVNEIENYIKLNIKGYSMFSNVDAYFGNCTTVNEALHLLHAFVMNNENILQSMNVLDIKDISGYSLTLYGKPSPETKEIFDSCPSNTGSGDTDSIGLPGVNKSLMMVRDKGHALSIEVTYEDKDAVVEYFIPKLCNIDMINALPGVVKVKEGTPMHNGTTGMFVTTKDILPYELSDFVRMVPEDKDIPMVHCDGPIRRV